ncbi:hypothetical protein B9P52_32000 [Achromobacter denitrificans]|uniref:hypothetical protein n=1 Tax=Achromobacter denitrificans TaxID=32002 RepID=UPI000B4DB7AE|nr:hypothetical protein [Achromobacter denitrificans]ASC68620.1 hypothetical protein B9P52_32000 [Achromobacter denitrificans]
MTKINDGGSAFPWGEQGAHLGSMTLRDAFAMRAMQAAEPPIFYMSATQTQMSLDKWAAHCWQMADAMLSARGAQ